MNGITVQMSDPCRTVPSWLGTTSRTMNQLRMKLVQRGNTGIMNPYVSELFSASYCPSYVHL